MGRLTRIKNRHRAIKNQINTLMTEDEGRTLFPRHFTKWLNKDILYFNRQEGLYAFTCSPILQEDRIIDYVNDFPNSTTEQIACALELDERRCYIALMSLRSQGKDINFFEYTNGEWSINDDVDMSFLYWNEEETTELVDENDMIGVLARHIRDVFQAKKSFQLVERKYDEARLGFDEKKQNFKNHLEELDLI